MLINLDREYKEVVASVTIAFASSGKGTIDRAHAVRQDLRKAKESREALTVFLTGSYQLR